jgi:hypothetical protein
MNYIFHPLQEDFDDALTAKGTPEFWQGPPGSRHLFCQRALQQDVTSPSSISFSYRSRELTALGQNSTTDEG